MGNRAKRVKLAARLKELGLGKLYHGNKKLAWRILDYKLLHRILQYNIGDVVHDCDGNNHVIAKYLPQKSSYKHWFGYGRGWFLLMDQIEFTDGRWSCGCDTSPDPPESRESIEEYFSHYVNDAKLKEQGWLDDPKYDLIREALAAGKHICDERGILLKEFA